MLQIYRFFHWTAVLGLAPGLLWAQTKEKFELRDGDRVVFIGDTLIEREQAYGYVEFLFTATYPDRNVTFRNLGWSADTPAGESRAGFDTPDKGFDRLREQLALVKPTVAVVGYGMACSFDGEAALPRFTADMNRLLDAIEQAAGSNSVRFIILSPIRHERLAPPFPDPTPHNQQLAKYMDALRAVASQRGAHFIPLFDILNNQQFVQSPPPLTDNGIHLTEYGYRRLAETLAMSLGWEAISWQLGLRSDGKVREGSVGTKVLELEREPDRVKLVTLDDQLMWPPSPTKELDWPRLTPKCRMQILGLKPGRYDLKIDGQLVQTGVDPLRSVLYIERGAQLEQAARLVQAIRKKNELFFHRYRPQNNTYLFLFRKHEQGQNAKEIPQFDPLIEEQEKRIAQLRKPVSHAFELVPSQGKADEVKPGSVPSPAVAPSRWPLPAFDVQPELEIGLFAENPLLAKPIHMNFDAQGRLWVASSEVYPQIKPGQEAADKILVLEDTDGDGRAEKSMVFAEGLLIPTGIEPGDGGAYVAQSTELLHFKDTNGDGKADERRVVLSGFGTEDTHHILHSLRWGPDGQLYMNQSIYIHTHTETPHGVVRLNSGGILNLRVPTMELGVTMKGLVNSWGHALDRFGQSFATDGASSADPWRGGLNWVIPQAMFFTYERARRTLDSISPSSYPKFCGLEVVHSEHFPEDWQGTFVTCDFRAHRVVRFALTERDSAYVTRELPDLVRTKDVAFRPIDVKLGPDGALYIADWSNPIIQHGEVDFRDPRRDHERGRIWRIAHKGRPRAPKKDLIQADSMELLNQLTSENDFNRQQARRVLVGRGPGIVAELRRWASQQPSERGRLEALWTYQALDTVEPALLEELLSAQDPRVRAAAVRVLAFWMERRPGQEGGSTSPALIANAAAGWPNVPQPLTHRAEIPPATALNWLAKAVADDHPRVRVEALRALARIPTARAAELALSAAERPLDKYLDYTLWLTVNDLARPWIAALQSGEWKHSGREPQLAYGLKAIKPALASEVLGGLLGERSLPRDGSGFWIELIGQAGTPKELRRLFDQVLQGGFDDEGSFAALNALNEAARLRSAKPTGDLTEVGTLFDHPAEKTRIAAVRLAGGWKQLGPHLPKLGALAGQRETSAVLRQAAFDTLRDVGGQSSVDILGPLTAKAIEPTIRQPATLALAALKLDAALPPALDLIAETANEAEALALWRTLLNIKGAAGALTKALPKTSLPPPAAKAGLRAAREGGRSEPDLVLALTRAGGLEEGEVPLTESELRQLMADVQSKGDPARGETVYRRKELSCVACHAIGGAGGKVGPDMTSLGASAPVDYLIESVWFPNRKIKEGYHALMVETKDGQEFSGTLVAETPDQITLRDATDRPIPIAKPNVAARRTGTLSLMPAGLIDGLTPQERIDLFRFLSELGKPGPFDASKGNVARVWRLRPGVHTLEQFGEEKILAGDVRSSDWTPAYSRVDGWLTAEAIRETMVVGKYLGLTALYASARLQVPSAGQVKLHFTGPADAALWVDGRPVQPGADLALDLAAGLRTIIIRLDPKALPEQVRLEASNGTFELN